MLYGLNDNPVELIVKHNMRRNAQRTQKFYITNRLCMKTCLLSERRLQNNQLTKRCVLSWCSSKHNHYGFAFKESFMCNTHSWYVIIVGTNQSNLTHWSRVTHICVSNSTIIGLDNGLSPGRRQAIIWTNAGILLIRTLGTQFSEIISEIHTFLFKKMHLKM